MQLPKEFCDRMCYLLGDEAKKYFECFENEHYHGIRVNTIKCSIEKIKKIIECNLESCDFSPINFYVPNDFKPGSSPLFHAGAFYSQEPSASSAVTALNPQEGEHILDLCAAPGGKSTQIAAYLNNTGLLWSNEIIRSRAKILSSNIERMGIKNAVVSCCYPEILCSKLKDSFDRVLVDAPCSGEGMFRKEPKAVEDWSIEHVKACAERQSAILESASQAVMPGGVLVYSTCTFSREENEGVIENFLDKHKEFYLEDTGLKCGRKTLTYATRIFPMDKGEGHFVAKMRKRGENSHNIHLTNNLKYIKVPDVLKSFWNETFTIPVPKNILQIGEKLISLPDNLPDIQKLGVLRAGVTIGSVIKNRFQPEHALFMSSKPDDLKYCVDFDNKSQEIKSFLHGDELQIDDDIRGYCGISVNGIVTGFGKCSYGHMKNHYPKGLRISN